MTRSTPALLSCALVGILLPTMAQSQIPVIDASNLFANTTTSIQSIITAANSVLTVANQVLDLTPVEEIVLAQSIAEDAALLADIIATAGAVYTDVQSLQAQIAVLFDLGTAPLNATELSLRLIEIRRVRAEAYIYAMRTQTLMATLLRTIGHVTTLITQVGTIIGNVQGQQHIVQVNTSINHTLAVLEVQTASFQRAESLDTMEHLLVQESLSRINADIMADWPRR
jgi:hypothetical protein